MDRSELLRTHYRDKQKGNIIKVVPYTMRTTKSGGRIYEKAGAFYRESGEPCDPHSDIATKQAELDKAQKELNKMKADAAAQELVTKKPAQTPEPKLKAKLEVKDEQHKSAKHTDKLSGSSKS